MPELELTGRPLLGTTRDEGLFVGREEELRTVEDSFAARMNVLLLGDRGAGKTTFLRQLALRLERNDWRAVFVEGGLASSPGELLSLVHARLSPESGSGREPPASTFEIVWGAVGARTVARRPEGAAGESQLLLEAVRALRADVQGERPHAVLIDEVASPEIVHALFGRLRDEIWQLPIVWLVAGSGSDRQVYLRPPADAFFSRMITLGPLAPKEALALVRARVPRAKASDALLRGIVTASSGMPRDLVSLAADAVIGGAKPEDVARSRAKRYEVVASLGEPARRVVAELEANGPASASDEAFLARLGFGRSRAAQVLGELERLGIVESSTERHAGQRPRKRYGLARVPE